MNEAIGTIKNCRINEVQGEANGKVINVKDSVKTFKQNYHNISFN